MFIDAHTHLHFKDYDRDRDAVVQRAVDAKVNQIISLGIDYSSSLQTITISEKYPRIFAAVGIHPSEAHLAKREDCQNIKSLAEKESKVVAIGEIGLDFYWDTSHPDEQYSTFRQMLRLAGDLNLPVIIHNRRAHREMEWFFQEEAIYELRGVMHCFSGDIEDARFYLDMGLHISYTGNITYPDFRNLNVVKFIPLDRLLLETDCPYMTPEPHRKKRNEPAYVVNVGGKLASLHQKPVEEIARITSDNAKRLFCLK
jgi:TatD DNase family protein